MALANQNQLEDFLLKKLNTRDLRTRATKKGSLLTHRYGNTGRCSWNKTISTDHKWVHLIHSKDGQTPVALPSTIKY